MKADGEDNNLDKDVENDIKDNMNAKDNKDLGDNVDVEDNFDKMDNMDVESEGENILATGPRDCVDVEQAGDVVNDDDDDDDDDDDEEEEEELSSVVIGDRAGASDRAPDVPSPVVVLGG